VIAVVQWLANLPGAAISIPPFPVWLVFVMYAVIFMMYWHLSGQTDYKKLPAPADN
jgi:hypothetical protein